MKRHYPNKSKTKAPLSRVRIIGGQWRGRWLQFPAVDGLRPTGDRQRETLFNWMQMDVPGSRCLDLFSGSGVLGLEALSRGASHVTLIEKNRTAFQCIHQSIESLQIDRSNVQIINASANDFLEQKPSPHDVVFIDPPYALDLWDQTMAQLSEGWLKPGAILYIEMPKSRSLQMIDKELIIKEKSFGDSVAYLMRTL